MFETKINKVLIVGAGSGRDISAATLILFYLLRNNPECKVDIAGFLTPWAIHLFNHKIENPINKLNDITHFNKIIFNKIDITKKFFEPIFYNLVKKLNGWKIKNIYLFSLHYNYSELIEEIKNLVNIERYELIFIIDVGGDILGNLSDKSSLLTPIVDWVCKKIFIEISNELNVDSYLFIVSPGVDGEIVPEKMEKYLSKSKFKIKMEKDDTAIKTYCKINDEIEKRTSASSHTFKIIKEIINEPLIQKKIIEKIYKKIYYTPFGIFTSPFKVKLNADFIKSIFIFSLKDLNSNSFNYNSLFDFWHMLEEKKVCGTEIDVSIIPTNIKKWENENINSTFISSPSCYFKGKIREEFVVNAINYFLAEKANIRAEYIILNKKDFSKELENSFPGLIFSNFSNIIKCKAKR